MRQNTWFCIMRVMSKLGIFKPYIDFIEALLRRIDNSVERELKQSKKWISEQGTPHLGEFRNWFGHGWATIAKILVEEGDISIDDDMKIRAEGLRHVAATRG